MLNNYNGNLLNNMGAMNNPRARFKEVKVSDFLLNQNFYPACHVFNIDGRFDLVLKKQTESAFSRFALSFVFFCFHY